MTYISQTCDSILILTMSMCKGYQAHLHDFLCITVPERFQGSVPIESMGLCCIEVLQRLVAAWSIQCRQTLQCSQQLASVRSHT